MSTRLKKRRTILGLTLREVSDLSGVSVAMLSRVERGERQLSALGRAKLARALGARIPELFPS